jgi:hypothetical protein
MELIQGIASRCMPQEASIHSGPPARKPNWADSMASMSSGWANLRAKEAQKIFQAPVEQAMIHRAARAFDRDSYLLSRGSKYAGSRPQCHARQVDKSASMIGVAHEMRVPPEFLH